MSGSHTEHTSLAPLTMTTAPLAASTGNMHRALACPDLISLVLDGVYKMFPVSLRLSTLQAVARTCHTLLEPALDYLWYDQIGLGHLVQCLPEDLWLTEGKSNEILVCSSPNVGTIEHGR